jgi:hypothetical protein
VNDAIGGATSGTLNLTQTAIGGSVFLGSLIAAPGGNATSTLIGTNPSGASIYNLTANATGGRGFGGGSATATADASAAKSGIANATATAIGGVAFGGFGGAASATATSTALLGGTANATATATGGFQSANTNANSFATTINGNAAQALSTASGGLGQAQATAQTNFGNFTSVQSTSTSPVGGGTTAATAIAQAGGVVSLSNPIVPGQSFSVVSGAGFGALTVANGSMGAGYGGINGISVTYKESVSFTQIGGNFVLDLLSSDALGIGFDSALFQISLNGLVIDSQPFTDLASAEVFFSNNLINVPLLAGSNSVLLIGS